MKSKPRKSKKAKAIVRYRSAVSGEFVPEHYANRYPHLTIKDTMKLTGN